MALALAVGPGCSKEKEPAEDTGAKLEVSLPGEVKEAAEAGAEAVDEAAVLAVLAKADLVDGSEDKVVSKCGTCALGMDGKAEHSLKTSGYTMYFCSEHCRDAFAENTDKSILAMKIPGE